MSYLFPTDTGRLTVVCRGDDVRAFRLFGRRHDVAAVLNRWRIDEGWWCEHQRRDYFKVLTQSGWLVVLYHDLIGGGWYLERIED
jgi:hypothetical protein